MFTSYPEDHADSSIEWTDHTFNPWWGCSKVSPACDNCYAELWAKRMGHRVWGSSADRRFFSDSHWNEPLAWNEEASMASEKKKGFLREHGRRVRTSQRIESSKNATLELDRTDAVAGLAAPDEAASKTSTRIGSLEKGLACKRLVRHDSGKPAFRGETAPIFAKE